MTSINQKQKSRGQETNIGKYPFMSDTLQVSKHNNTTPKNKQHTKIPKARNDSMSLAEYILVEKTKSRHKQQNTQTKRSDSHLTKQNFVKNSHKINNKPKETTRTNNRRKANKQNQKTNRLQNTTNNLKNTIVKKNQNINSTANTEGKYKQ